MCSFCRHLNWLLTSANTPLGFRRLHSQGLCVDLFAQRCIPGKYASRRLRIYEKQRSVIELWIWLSSAWCCERWGFTKKSISWVPGPLVSSKKDWDTNEKRVFRWMSLQLKRKINSCSSGMVGRCLAILKLSTKWGYMWRAWLKYKTEKARVADNGHEFREEMRASSISERYRVEMKSGSSMSLIKLTNI